jgi:hypothetical protein
MSPLARCTTAFSACTTSVPCVRWTLPVKEHGPSPATVQSVLTGADIERLVAIRRARNGTGARQRRGQAEGEQGGVAHHISGLAGHIEP